MKLWLLSSAIVSTACLAACGPPEEGEAEFAESESALKFDCILTDDLTNSCGCASVLPRPTPMINYKLSVGDIDFVRIRLTSGSYNITFRTATPPGMPAIDTYCTEYNSTCGAIGIGDEYQGGPHCGITTGAVVPVGTTRDMVFSVGSGYHPLGFSPNTGAYNIVVTINGHDYVPPVIGPGELVN